MTSSLDLQSCRLVWASVQEHIKSGPCTAAGPHKTKETTRKEGTEEANVDTNHRNWHRERKKRLVL